MDGRWQTRDKSSLVMRADELPTLCLRVLQYKEHPEQRHSGLDAEHKVKNNKRTKDSKEIRCKLDRDDPKKIKDIDNEGVNRKPKTKTKKLFIHGQAARTRYYSVPWPRDMDMNVIQEPLA